MTTAAAINTRFQIDILPALKREDSHGTAPLGWDIVVCSCPNGQLLAVPISRYSYPGMGFGVTFDDIHTSPAERVFLRWGEGIPILSN
ncbi:hypothetical protein [Halorubrum laminariae]|uniref:hypothetical protein n=1 Tax=Halorubrum laminariae TaxID=1433523 RepID=UPI002113640E|nr:hypothetical protein [Halorubrum laminariae]